MLFYKRAFTLQLLLVRSHSLEFTEGKVLVRSSNLSLCYFVPSGFADQLILVMPLTGWKKSIVL